MSQKYPEGAIIVSPNHNHKCKVLGCAGEARFLEVVEGLMNERNTFSIRSVESLEMVGWTVEEAAWVPKIGEKFFHVCSDGEIMENTNDDISSDKKFIKLGNCYQTIELAQAAWERVKKAYRG